MSKRYMHSCCSRRENKLINDYKVNARSMLLAASSNREDPSEIHDTLVEAKALGVRVPRSFRSEARVAMRLYREKFASIAGFCWEPERGELDASYVHPRAKRVKP